MKSIQNKFKFALLAASLALATALTISCDGDSFEYEGQTYKTVKIGTQTWMAENLNYKTQKGSWCYNSKASNCDAYGRFYDWATAMTVCPAGWHLPSNAEWNVLVTYAGDSLTAGTKLKAASGWGTAGNGTDNYGFSAVPGGYRNADASFGNVGSSGYWWSATEYNGTSAYYRYMYNSYVNVSEYDDDKSSGFSVRCVKD